MAPDRMREIQDSALESLHSYIQRVCIKGGTDAEINKLPEVVKTLNEQYAYVRVQEATSPQAAAL